MKKIIALLSFILIATVAMAQDQVFTAAGTKGVTNTPAARKTAAYNYVFQVSLPVPYRYVLRSGRTTKEAHLQTIPVQPISRDLLIIPTGQTSTLCLMAVRVLTRY